MLTFKSAIAPGQVTVKFSGKPDGKIRSALKANGFWWSPADGVWCRRRVEGAADFLTWLDRALNPDRPDGACWRCKAPEGFFRPRGAATPVCAPSATPKTARCATPPTAPTWTSRTVAARHADCETPAAASPRGVALPPATSLAHSGPGALQRVKSWLLQFDNG